MVCIYIYIHTNSYVIWLSHVEQVTRASIDVIHGLRTAITGNTDGDFEALQKPVQNPWWPWWLKQLMVKIDEKWNYNMGVSWNRGTPKSSIFTGFSAINHPFGGTPFMETPIWFYIAYNIIVLILWIVLHSFSGLRMCKATYFASNMEASFKHSVEGYDTDLFGCIYHYVLHPWSIRQLIAQLHPAEHLRCQTVLRKRDTVHKAILKKEGLVCHCCTEPVDRSSKSLGRSWEIITDMQTIRGKQIPCTWGSPGIMLVSHVEPKRPLRSNPRWVCL